MRSRGTISTGGCLRSSIRDELIVKGDVGIGRDWSVYYNVRWAGYDWTDAGKDKSDNFLNPHVALVWAPLSSVEIRFGYGINPLY